jgi:hypothetical protein
MRFLFAWELGANLGHLHTIKPAALELCNRGHSVWIVVPNVELAARVIDDPRVGILPGPLSLTKSTTEPPPFFGYGDALIPYGFCDPQSLRARVRAWSQLFDLVKPDLVIAHAAPTALLALQGTAIASCVFGTGYHCPPDRTPLPLFVPEMGASVEDLAAREKAIVATMNQARPGGPEFRALRDLFDRPQILTTLPELDHYRERPPGALFVGPQFSLNEGSRIKWNKQSDLHVFAYLRGPLASNVAALFSRMLVSFDLWIAAPGAEAASFTPAGATPPSTVHIVPHALSIADARKADVAITYGGHNSSAALLLGGVPLILLPQNVEQVLAARAVKDLGAGVMVGHPQPLNINLLVESALRCTHGARSFARNHSAFSLAAQTGEICNNLVQMASLATMVWN